MSDFETLSLADAPQVVAPDGSRVRPLLQVEAGSMAVFELAPGLVSVAVAHHNVAELWYFLGGRGEIWRRLDSREQTIPVQAGVCISIPKGAWFQFRCTGDEPLRALGVTMPPWPGPDEAYEVQGPWQSRVE